MMDNSTNAMGRGAAARGTTKFVHDTQELSQPDDVSVTYVAGPHACAVATEHVNKLHATRQAHRRVALAAVVSLAVLATQLCVGSEALTGTARAASPAAEQVVLVDFNEPVAHPAYRSQATARWPDRVGQQLVPERRMGSIHIQQRLLRGRRRVEASFQLHGSKPGTSRSTRTTAAAWHRP